MKAPASDHERDGRRRAVGDVVAPLEELAARSAQLFSAHLDYRDVRGALGRIPRFLFTGPGDQGSFLRVGVFAGIHGEDTGGVFGALELLRRLEQAPTAATGYELFVYPVCNPWGFSRRARWLQSGADMDREFWRGSDEIEVLVLEGQLMKLAFDGVVVLASAETDTGLQGFTRGTQILQHVLEPALRAGSLGLGLEPGPASLPPLRGQHDLIGALSPPPSQKPRPFEILLETPSKAAESAQAGAHVTATLTILEGYRRMISEAQNI